MVDFTNAVRSQHSNPVYPSGKSEILEQYQSTYGQKQGKSMLAQQIAGTSDKSSRAYKSAMRDLQGGRENRPSKYASVRSQYETVGKKLPPSSYNPKSNTIKVTVTGSQTGGQYRRDSHGNSVYQSSGERTRSFSATFSGPDAYDFVNNPSLRALLKQMGYSDHTIDLLESGEYELAISSVA